MLAKTSLRSSCRDKKSMIRVSELFLYNCQIILFTFSKNIFIGFILHDHECLHISVYCVKNPKNESYIFSIKDYMNQKSLLYSLDTKYFINCWVCLTINIKQITVLIQHYLRLSCVC